MAKRRKRAMRQARTAQKAVGGMELEEVDEGEGVGELESRDGGKGTSAVG